MTAADLESFPLCRYFLSDYLANREDPTNFPPDQWPDVLQRYEKISRSALDTLKLEKEALKRRSEFEFSHATPANLESAIAVLRAASALRIQQFSAITMLDPPGADLRCERDGRTVCCEMKSIGAVSSFHSKRMAASFELDLKAGELYSAATPQLSSEFNRSVTSWMNVLLFHAGGELT